MRKIFLSLFCLTLINCFSLHVFANSSTVERKWYEKLNKLNGTEQVLVVTTNYAKARNGKLVVYQKENGMWKKVLTEIDVVVGKNGITTNKKEGDGKTPSGVFRIGTAFGTSKKPSGVKMPYRQTTKYDYWVDDPLSSDYNKWVHYRGNPAKRWKSFERLNHPLYKYAIVVRYNESPIRKGKGSAIFIHIWPRPSGYTLGCIAMSEKNLLKIMQKLDPKKKPIIVISEKDKQLQALK
jgi:L,D-peptidoglycan transpeptidase YkuD (ErfK/YbiS/YcfS/YnhG family)